MQSSDVQTRCQELAASYIAKKGDASFKEIVKNANNHCFSFDYEGGPAMINYAHFDGLTIEKFAKYFENYAAWTHEMMNVGDDKGRLTIVPMAPQDGRPMSLHRMDPGVFMVSARSMVVSYYMIPGEGEFTFIGSSLGNDGHIAASQVAFKAATGNKSDGDVIGTLVMNYINVKASGNGVDIVHINISKPNGSIPNMVVSKMTAK